MLIIVNKHCAIFTNLKVLIEVPLYLQGANLCKCIFRPVRCLSLDQSVRPLRIKFCTGLLH